MTLQIPQTPPLFSTSLAAQLGASDNSCVLASAAMINGVALTGLISGSIDIGQPNPEYFIGTISGNTVTFSVRGCDPLNPTTSDPSLISLHRLGASVTITDYVSIGMLVNILNGVTPIANILSYAALQTFTPNSPQIPDVGYVNAQDQIILQQAEAFAEILIASQGGSGKPLSFATFTLDNYENPSEGFYSGTVTFNKQTASNGGNFLIQSSTQNIQIRNYVLDWATATDLIAYAIIGTLLYVQLTDGTNYRVYEYDTTNLSIGGTLCTGITFGTQSGVKMTSDGQSLFFNYNSGNSANDYEVDKYSVAGNALTFVSTTNLGSTGGVAILFLVDSAGNYYGFNGSNVVKQYNSLGVLQQTTASYPINQKVLNWSDSIYGESTNSEQFVLLEIVGTSDSFIGGNTTSMVAANDVTLGEKLGVSDIVGNSVDLVLRSNKTLSIPNFNGGISAVPIDVNKFALLYLDSSTSNLMAVICNSVQYGMTITPGTPQVIVASGSFDNNLTTSSSYPVITQTGTGQFAVTYTHSGAVNVICVTVSGTVMTIGTPVTAYTDANEVSNVRLVLVDTNKIMVFSNGSSRSNYIVGTISGTVPTFGTKQTDSTYFLTDSSFANFTQVSAGVILQGGFDNTTTSAAARVLSISGTVISFGTIVTSAIGGGSMTWPGNMVQITPTTYAFSSVGSNSSTYGFRVWFITISGTTVSNLIQQNIPMGNSGPTYYSQCWVYNGNVYGFSNQDDANNTGSRPCYKFIYSGGSSSTNAGVASYSTTFGQILINFGSYMIGLSGTGFIMSGVSTLSFLGYAQRAVLAGSKTLVLIGGVDPNQSNLIPGETYVVGANGTLSIGPTGNSYSAGKAISSNAIAYSV